MQKRSILFNAFLAALLCLSFLLDDQAARLFLAIRMPLLTQTAEAISLLSNVIAVTITMTLLLACTRTKDTKTFLTAILTTAATTYLLKYLIARPRPADGLEEALTRYSFPSGHSNAAFTAYPFLKRHFPRARWAWLAFSSLAAASRVYLGAHYLSDVVAGGLIGYTISSFILKKAGNNQKEAKPPRKGRDHATPKTL